ncbi:MAG: hypothetical protein PHY54_14575 [Methylococcales bacterium]|nr:hypothetical protein [Methylococcales bacterium]
MNFKEVLVFNLALSAEAAFTKLRTAKTMVYKSKKGHFLTEMALGRGEKSAVSLLNLFGAARAAFFPLNEQQ